MEAALTLRRIALRRMRPPSIRRIYWILYLATILGWIALAVIQVSAGHWWYAVNAAVWSLSFVVNRWQYQRDMKREETHEGALPVQRWEWAILAFMDAVLVFCWTILLVF